MWGYIEKYTEDFSLDPEWSDDCLKDVSIRIANPLGHKLYHKYLNKVISRPSESAESIYQDNNGGVSGYIPDSEKSGSSKKLYVILKPGVFHKNAAIKITNFDPSIATLEIDSDSFGVDSSATFAAGKDKQALKLAKQDFDFSMTKKGGLYFNENGSNKGFGDGSIIAILKGAPDLTSGNLDFI